MVDIGTRLELFVDNLLVERERGVQRRLHEPVLTPAVPGSPRVCYSTVLLDEGLYRRYQREVKAGYTGEAFDGHPGELTAYYESRDGVAWTAPKLGLVEVNGSCDNNVVVAGTCMCSHNFTPFRDANPEAPAAQRYKALGGVHPGGGLYAWYSPDGRRWQLAQSAPVMTADAFAFDSQNVAFWSTAEGCYVCYYRSWQTSHGNLRTISRCTSADFVHWSAPAPMDPNLPGEHLYTSNTQPYFRAPHLYLAFPTRFLPDRGASTDILLMSCRAGAPRYDRLFTEAYIRPGLDPERWGNRANYAAYSVVPTGPDELSFYVSDRRYVTRLDGFVSVRAGRAAGELLTRPLRFAGARLLLNYSTSAAGSVRVEVRDAEGRPVRGRRGSDCVPLVGDRIEETVRWRGGDGLADLAGQPVRLRFMLQEADLFSFRFAAAD